MTKAHLDYDALADLMEGLLDDDVAISAESHLTDCDECRGRLTEITEVSRVLAEAPIPPMPANLVDRIDAAIAEAAPSQMHTRRSGRRVQLIAAAAAGVVVVGGGAVVAGNLLHGTDSKNATASQPADRTTISSNRGAGGAPPQPAVVPDYSIVSSGTRYTSAQLARQVASAVARANPKNLHSERVAGPSQALAGCVARVTQGRHPILVDTATYKGAPATIIVLAESAPVEFDVWVVAPTCSTTDAHVIQHVRVAR